jgi:chorismate mutase
MMKTETTMTHHPELESYRRQIDRLDDQLVRILAERVELVKEIGRYKKHHGIDPLDQTRWQEVLKARMERALQLELSPEFVQQLYDLIHEHSLVVETDIDPEH